MSESTVAIVGSGIVGTTLAYLLTRRGHDVVVFEKGPEYPYPHIKQFREQTLYAYRDPAYLVPADVKNLTVSGDYWANVDSERGMFVGGTATHWGAVTPRMIPPDFDTKSRYGYGTDWPLSYDELEPYYAAAEWLLGVSGTDADNPFAPRRSRPRPLPPFELSYDDGILAQRLRRHGIVLHTTPQARTRHPFEQRPGCMNFGMCATCPIGARYSPNYHLLQAVGTGRCKVLANTSVRRILAGPRGRASAVVYRPHGGAADREHAAKVIIIAAGAIESARLLLLSSRDRHPDGVALSAEAGRHLTFHHLWQGALHYREAFRPGSVGAATGMCHQFLDAPSRGTHGAIHVDFSSHPPVAIPPHLEEKTGPAVVDAYRHVRHWRVISLIGETVPTARKYVTLAKGRDRFGDPFAHVQYESADFDVATHGFARRIFDQFAAATGADDADLPPVGGYFSAGHHLGTCRMGTDERDSVVDRLGRVHGSPNLFVAGGSTFPGAGAVHPTLTMVALTIRAARYIGDQLL